MTFDPFSYGGDHPFMCSYCAGMGYEDYPSNQIPCRIGGHKDQYESNLEDVMAMLGGFRKEYDSSTHGNCPYCKAAGREIGVDCEHWDGLGWMKDSNKNKYKDTIFR